VLYYGRNHETGSIGDRRFGQAGVERNLTALSAIDGDIRAADGERPELRETAYRLYLNTLQRALASGTSRQIRAAFRRAHSHATSRARRMRTSGLERFYRLFGAEWTRRALKAYSRFTSGGAPASNDPRPASNDPRGK